MALLVGFSFGSAGMNVARGDNTNVLAAGEFLPPDPSMWTHGFEFRAGGGYKDNLLLGPHDREKSPFFTAGGDFTLARLPLDGREFTLFLSLDDTRYLNGHQVDHEDFGLGVAQFKIDLGADWRMGLDARYLFQDQVLDTSLTETNLSPTLVRGHHGALLPNVRRSLPNSYWLELAGTAQRSVYDFPLDDYWEGGPKLTVGRDLANQSVVSVHYGWSWRAYDTRFQVSPSGTDVPGTSLAFQQHDVGLMWRKTWDARRRWRTILRGGFQTNRDNGSGYYDYDRYSAAPQFRYVAAPWELKVEARIAFYDFAHQPAATSDSDRRQKAVSSLGLRVERELGRQFRLYLDYTYEQSVANRATDDYQMNSVSGGALWAF